MSCCYRRVGRRSRLTRRPSLPTSPPSCWPPTATTTRSSKSCWTGAEPFPCPTTSDAAVKNAWHPDTKILSDIQGIIFICLSRHATHNITLCTYVTHLSKATSDLKQKCTQLASPFWDTVFRALSHGVIHFVRSVRSRNNWLALFVVHKLRTLHWYLI